jgi:hypothetical protein
VSDFLTLKGFFLFQKSPAWSRSASVNFVMSACPLAGISLKFDIGDFHENVPSKAKFIYNRTPLSSILLTGLVRIAGARVIRYA